jgi:hypothetical protein
MTLGIMRSMGITQVDVVAILLRWTSRPCLTRSRCAVARRAPKQLSDGLCRTVPPSPLSVPSQAGAVHRSVPLGISLAPIDLPKQLGGVHSHLNSHPLDGIDPSPCPMAGLVLPCSISAISSPMRRIARHEKGAAMRRPGRKLAWA